MLISIKAMFLKYLNYKNWYFFVENKKKWLMHATFSLVIESV